MKSARQIAILEIIAEKSIETQEDLADALRLRGFQVTQATVSRDISAYNQIIIRTLPASANIAAETIDSLQWPEVLGTIAGDNTILMIVRSVEEVRPVMERLNAMIRR
mgnify:CR=1 FL=1